ncbi:hypothetical protein CYLTODRAFT_240077 [Cylindrobasidium torrendii FP15055 ss-10]|uniref:Uncharacterized protein n=1 Tax=Cylindrobasidium torrendii FP15055 ss-10 TaxID=1314674 RepID=A0A0D7BUU8_9AGAR|nr:hypothetical protein CYLTODRAFT_240077 [Cylindrobasidium torrendii FP15055 ss-10]
MRSLRYGTLYSRRPFRQNRLDLLILGHRSPLATYTGDLHPSDSHFSSQVVNEFVRSLLVTKYTGRMAGLCRALELQGGYGKAKQLSDLRRDHGIALRYRRVDDYAFDDYAFDDYAFDDYAFDDYASSLDWKERNPMQLKYDPVRFLLAKKFSDLVRVWERSPLQRPVGTCMCPHLSGSSARVLVGL